MFKNYILINGILGIVLIGVVFFVTRTFISPVEVIDVTPLSKPTIENKMTEKAGNSIRRATPISFSDDKYSVIYEKNLLHPDRILPKEKKPENIAAITPTPQTLDCSQSGITLLGIVTIENSKPYCFLKSQQYTSGDVKIFHINEKIGEYTIVEIKDDAISLKNKSGSVCEILLFDFSVNKRQTKSRPTHRRMRVRPTPRRRRHRVSR